MTQARPTHIDYAEDEEHILRRLGGAVVALFDTLPEDIQELLVEQATHMIDRHQTVQLKQQIENFIAKKAGG
ncbi:MAG: hypothetical protein EON93_12175 [Burkholderiales bacterium]|nr:MAG: hypothetical protein EON93_12175 [Burkholderiales bacterium]